MGNISGDARKLIKDPFLSTPAAKKEEKTEASADAAHEKLAFQEHISLFPYPPVSSAAATEASSECIKRSRKKVGERREGWVYLLYYLLYYTFPPPSSRRYTSRETREEEEGRVKISPSYREAADFRSPGFGFVFGLFYPIRRLRVLYLLSPSPHPRAASLRKSRKLSSSSSPSSQEEEATTDCPSPSSSSHYFYLSPPTTVGGSEAAKAVDVSSSSSSVSCAHFAPHGASASLWTGTKAASAPQREVGG